MIYQFNIQKKMTASEVALEVLVQLEIHGISIKDFARELNSQYKENKDLRDENISYLKELQDFTRLKNGAIQDVIQFLENLNYYL